MPNIMMFGFTDSDYRQKKNIIDKTMQELGLGNDAITTYFKNESCKAETCDGKRQYAPYIRVCSTGGQEEIDKIINALKKQNICVDCEKLILPSDGFLTAKQMQT